MTQDPSAFVVASGGRKVLDVMVRGASCAGCLSKIETAIAKLPGVAVARLNLSTGRLHVEWTGNLAPRRVTEAVAALGYGAAPFDPGEPDSLKSQTERRLLTAMAVAGLSAAMIMFLSEPVWFGSDMPAETRTLLRWVSALVAVPAAAFSGQTFYASALESIRRGRLNMDVPISLAVILALGLSIVETATGGQHAFFDASVMLLFFLLIGRFLDARLRRQAYAAANALTAMQTSTATRLSTGGAAEAVRASDIRTGDMLLIAAGEKLAVDAEVVSGDSDADLRLVTGEVEPSRAFAGQRLHAGTINLSAPLRVRAIAPASQSLMADVARLLEAGEQKKSTYRKIADRAAEIYVPQVHAMAALGFVGWLMFGATAAQAAYIAVTVLIITCPCALALAAPLVQVVAAGRLFREGAYLSSGDALERIATVDHVVFDKTGTLTLGDPVLREEPHQRQVLAEAAMLARASRHPFSRALARAAGAGPVADNIEERAGEGVSGVIDGRKARLGSAAFAGATGRSGSELWFVLEGSEPEAFQFEDHLRDDAARTVSRLRAMGLEVELLSGDAEERVARAAAAAGIDQWTSRATPQSKARHLQDLEGRGKKVLMVGDGLNDAGAIACAHASLAPGGAVDVSRLASDCVFSGDSLEAVVRIVLISRAARARMRENFSFAALYNVLAVPIALAGWATPLVAAIAMSASSAVVTLNALRLSQGRLAGEKMS
ncbi:MAG: heavy metal translocating P-type ATPase [Hyphomonadaceae bacterium]|nr:heavy metal translocating P-type ATPase [Hyphomonadaceae bacterium]